MILYDSKGTKFHCNKVYRPKFTHHRGRTWDTQVKTIDGLETKFHFDSTWGFNFYFVYNNQWYRASIMGERFTGTEGIDERRELFTKPIPI